jgi:hypothetical protein
VQVRRVLLLFALVLGLSAIVASIAPPPETRDEPAQTTPAPPPDPLGRGGEADVTIAVRMRPREPSVHRVVEGSSLTLHVDVREAGDVVIEGLGLRQPADRLAPARFDLLAQPRGRFAVAFEPLRGERRVVGLLEFVAEAALRPRSRDR